MTQENKSRATLAAMAATGATALAAESYIYLIAKIKQKNGGTFKLLDAVDIDWTGFDWSQSGVPSYTLPAATDKVLGGVKIGANISNDAGTISVSGDNVKAALGFTPAEGDDTGAAKNALQLGGHGVDYYATKAELDQAANESTWKPSVTNAAALKALKAPKDTDTRALLDTNEIYMFNSDLAETEDKAPDIYVPDDGTKGAWFLKSHMVYSPATQTTDGLMSASDKKILDGVQGKLDSKADKAEFETTKTKVDGMVNIKAIGTGLSLNADTGTLSAAEMDISNLATKGELTTGLSGKVDKIDGKGLSTNDFTAAYKSKVDSLTNTCGTFFASKAITGAGDVALADITIPAGMSIKAGDSVIDANGAFFPVTKVTADTVTVDAGKGSLLASAEKTKLSGLANIKTIGSGLVLAADGTLTANVQSVDLSAYQKTVDADAKYETKENAAATYATKADVDIVSSDFISGLFA